jgi:hypothetical protein
MANGLEPDHGALPLAASHQGSACSRLLASSPLTWAWAQLGSNQRPLAHLQRGQGLGLPSGENVARLIGAEVLGEEELGLSAHGWTAETPLWLYIQREAAARHAGDRLGEGRDWP